MRSGWAKLTLSVLLVLSLGLKAPSSDASDQPSVVPEPTALISALSERGFYLSTKDGFESATWVADKGACHIEVATVTPLGWHQSAMAELVGTQIPVYVYAGRIYDKQPVMLTKFDYYWHKLTSYFYRSWPLPPVYGVVTSADCAKQSADKLFVARLLP